MSDTPYIPCCAGRRRFWICRICGEPFDTPPSTPHCEPESDQATGAVMIAISVGTFALLIFLAWLFCYLMGWLA